MTPEAVPPPVPPELQPYLAEIRIQLSAANAAFVSLEARIAKRKEVARRISRILAAGGPPPLTLEREEFEGLVRELANQPPRILSDVQGFLAAIGVIAKLLWPSPVRRGGASEEKVAKRLARGESLRRLLEVDPESVLKIRGGNEEDVRGGMLHFDEMLDDALDSGGSGPIETFYVGSSKEGTMPEPKKAIRRFDEDSLELWVGDRRGELRAYLEAARRVGTRIQSKAKLSYIVNDGASRERPIGIGMRFDTTPPSTSRDRRKVRPGRPHS
jgi:hypothetical protein